jgi:hypothetical protein
MPAYISISDAITQVKNELGILQGAMILEQEYQKLCKEAIAEQSKRIDGAKKEMYINLVSSVPEDKVIDVDVNIQNNYAGKRARLTVTVDLDDNKVDELKKALEVAFDPTASIPKPAMPIPGYSDRRGYRIHYSDAVNQLTALIRDLELADHSDQKLTINQWQAMRKITVTR